MGGLAHLGPVITAAFLASLIEAVEARLQDALAQLTI